MIQRDSRLTWRFVLVNCCCMVSATTAEDLEQFELISDDPRVDAEKIGPLQLFRAFRKAREEHGELLARPLAAEILGVTPSQLSVWVSRGRFTDVVIGPVKLIPANEVEAMWRERSENGNAVGGRGKKLPSMSEVLRLGSQITK